jgi:hypothetical protein
VKQKLEKLKENKRTLGSPQRKTQRTEDERLKCKTTKRTQRKVKRNMENRVGR